MRYKNCSNCIYFYDEVNYSYFYSINKESIYQSIKNENNLIQFQNTKLKEYYDEYGEKSEITLQ